MEKKRWCFKGETPRRSAVLPGERALGFGDLPEPLEPSHAPWLHFGFSASTGAQETETSAGGGSPHPSADRVPISNRCVVPSWIWAESSRFPPHLPAIPSQETLALNPSGCFSSRSQGLAKWVRDKILHGHTDSPSCPPCNHRMNHGAQIRAAFGKKTGSFCRATKADVDQRHGWSPQRWRCHLPAVLAWMGVCWEPVPPWVCLVASRERVLQSPCHCDGGTQHSGVQSCAAPRSRGFLRTTFASHRVRDPARVQRCCFLPPVPHVDGSTGTQWAPGDNGLLGTGSGHGGVATRPSEDEHPSCTTTAVSSASCSSACPLRSPFVVLWGLGAPQDRGGPICTQARGPQLVSAPPGGSL